CVNARDDDLTASTRHVAAPDALAKSGDGRTLTAGTNVDGFGLERASHCQVDGTRVARPCGNCKDTGYMLCVQFIGAKKRHSIDACDDGADRRHFWLGGAFVLAGDNDGRRSNQGGELAKSRLDATTHGEALPASGTM